MILIEEFRSDLVKNKMLRRRSDLGVIPCIIVYLTESLNELFIEKAPQNAGHECTCLYLEC